MTKSLNEMKEEIMHREQVSRITGTFGVPLLDGYSYPLDGAGEAVANFLPTKLYSALDAMEMPHFTTKWEGFYNSLWQEPIVPYHDYSDADPVFFTGRRFLAQLDASKDRLAEMLKETVIMYHPHLRNIKHDPSFTYPITTTKHKKMLQLMN